MKFTFFGDLLGISSIYKLSSDKAYEKLNEFYNTTFSTLEEKCTVKDSFEVSMFSDSLIAYGDDAENALKVFSVIFMKLLNKGLLLRGAMVKGRLTFDPRLDRSNFRKMLPQDDTLARVVGLGNTQKGARFLVETHLAQELLRSAPEWLTHDGYVRQLYEQQIPYDHILRRLCPTPDSTAFEVLYFWVCNSESGQIKIDYPAKRDELCEIQKMVDEGAGKHYKATFDLLRRCENRQKYTDKKLRGEG